jgi:hypothetical protein
MRLTAFTVASALLLAAADPARAEGADYVSLRTTPLSFAVDGVPMNPVPGGGTPAWFWDLFGVGMSFGQLDLAFLMSAQNPAPRPYEFSVLYARLTGAWRPLKRGRLQFAEPYVFGGVGFGWAGSLVKRNPSCVDSATVRCEYDRSGLGGGPAAGVGVDFNLPVAELSSGQRVYVYAGIELRAELFLHQGLNLFGVYSLPIGLRLQ